MDELQEAFHKFEKSAHELEWAGDCLNADDERSVALTLGVAKRVRRNSNILVRELARARDNLHSQEADNKS